MTENTDNNNNSNYIEYYMLNSWWGNEFITSCYCSMCGVIAKPDSSNNIYQVKDLFYCEKHYCDIQLQHAKRGVSWGGYLYWESVKESPDLQ